MYTENAAEVEHLLFISDICSIAYCFSASIFLGLKSRNARPHEDSERYVVALPKYSNLVQMMWNIVEFQLSFCCKV